MKKAIVIGAGPAGLTAAYELLKNTDIIPVVFEKSDCVGGISKTVAHNGNRIDIGGHRFFSKSDKVMDFWKSEMEIANINNLDRDVFLIRNRKSRIYYLKKFFDYPVKLNLNTIKNLGFFRMMKIGMSYSKTLLHKRKEATLEDFMINSFGKELYLTFFKSYTEKVWGVKCNKIKAEWGRQRIKGLSIAAILKDIFKKFKKRNRDINQKDIETSLIEKFMYPKYGPGNFWQHIADKIIKLGGEINYNSDVIKIEQKNNKIEQITVNNNGKIETYTGGYFISTMPLKELILKTNNIDESITELAKDLLYRDFITVGVLVDRKDCNVANILDNWVYIQEENSIVGRIQIFNNWSPYMVRSEDKIWFGLEYFCNENDNLWNLSDDSMKKMSIKELTKIGFIENYLNVNLDDSVVIRVQKAYPCYFGNGYDNFEKIRNYMNSFENLFLIGRNGMHRYNNMDHSMLTAMEAVNNIRNNIRTKDNIWQVNVEKEYHECRTNKA